MFRAINLANLGILRNISKSFGCSTKLLYHTENGVFGHRPRKAESHDKGNVAAQQNRIQECQLYQLVEAYRTFGHKKAKVDPLELAQLQNIPELDPQRYGLSLESTKDHNLQGILNVDVQTANTKEVIDLLENLYCSSITAEFQHCVALEEREWFSSRYEQLLHEELANDDKVKLAKLMLKSQAFDHFLANKFSTVKRYGGEGCERAMGFYDELFKLAAQDGVKDVTIAIAHRGRLNLLTVLMKFPPVAMFRKMKGKREFPPNVVGHGDVVSHLTSSCDVQYGENSIHLTMVPNPSHLESANPVAVGKTRSKQLYHQAGDYVPIEVEDMKPGDSALCLQIHGDAAFTAQGIVAETFTIAETPHFDIGGSIHLVINNQLGFTTGAERGRSSHHVSDIGKLNGNPVIHVNGDNPEDVVKACKMSFEYRQKFRKDVIVNLVCFRRWGHNEMDDPAFTQPKMYNVIRNRRSIPDTYGDKVVERNICSKEELNESVTEWNKELSENLSQLESYVPEANHCKRQWVGMEQAPPNITTWDTGMPVDVLKFVGAKSVTVPDDFAVHPQLMKTHVGRRLNKMEEGRDIDWATAESLAIGSCLYQGFNVRISGQDVGRGTFSHRHAMLVNQQTDEVYIPLNNITEKQTGFFEVANSALTEEAVLGFEYGFSIDNPTSLAIWEAQFGDFFNGAQIIIDTFVSSGETKWLLQSSLVVLLPHGMDGAGPEHSSCRIERFLQNCDSKEESVDGQDVNMHICNPTTPAQYFHLLRRQMVRNYRKPVIIASPKTLLRLPAAVSTLQEMAPGTTFLPVLPAAVAAADSSKITRVLFVCGKHYYTLAKEMESKGIKNVAVLSIEELCPFPAEAIKTELNKYPNAQDFIWSQEEHRNQGAWTFAAPRFENILGIKLKYAGRAVQTTSATGVGEIHQREMKEIIEQTFN